jgi:Arc/MetJ-type ribon-helix-helix transcriptional regulator
MAYEKQVAIRLPPKDIEGIEQCVNEGYASNQSDFVRQAVRNYISECKKAIA